MVLDRSVVLVAAAALSATASLVACVSFGPSFVQSPPPLVLFSNDTGVVIDCLARGEPTPIVDWVDQDGNTLPFMSSTVR